MKPSQLAELAQIACLKEKSMPVLFIEFQSPFCSPNEYYDKGI
jgi:hypothetical protein